MAGSENACRDLVVKYERPVFSIILRMVRNKETAEDLAQETFVKAFRALASFDADRKFSSWLFTIAHNTTIDFLRRKTPVTVPLETAGEDERDLLGVLAAPEAETPEARVLGRDLARSFETALAALRSDYAEVLVLRFQEGLTYEEIAAVTTLPLGTVKTHLYRARRELARRLAAMGVGPGPRGDQ